MDAAILLLLGIYLLDKPGPAATETRVGFDAPVNPVVVGGILAVQCQIWEMQGGYTVMIMRTIDGESEQITNGPAVTPVSSVANRVYLSVRTFRDGSVVYFVTLLDISDSDRGEYGCTVFTMSNRRFIEIADNSTNVLVASFPEETQPTCSSNPDNLVMQENTMLRLMCSAYKTFPVVDLKWRQSSVFDRYLPSSESTYDESTTSIAVLRAEMMHNGAIFLCEMTSKGFPDRMRTCQIGPITVVSSVKGNIGNDVNRITIIPQGSDTRDLIKTDSTQLSEDCTETCQSSIHVVFYLTISTASASLLCFIFFITTLVMCCKYHSISSNVRNTQEYIPHQECDPVYVSLQRRRHNEQVYMTLEDPNNPDGKVLLPKEVFDEFYNRTLSIRKS